MIGDVMEYFALAAAAVDQIKYPKKCPMNPKKIVAPEQIAAETGLAIVVEMMMMIKDQMKKLNSKNSAETEEKKCETLERAVYCYSNKSLNVVEHEIWRKGWTKRT